MKRLFTPIICASVLLLAGPLSAQMTVTDGYTADELANDLVGYGVTISDVELTCPDGNSGKFECSDCSLNIDAGIVLTSGSATLTEGPNNSSASTGTGTGPGDPDLEDLLPGYTSYDACVLEFDVVATADSVKFEYVFGSEEYLEWVGSSFNDVFGFFISGPGIVGTDNMALIPGTTIPVSINNVNDFSYSDYYVDNGDGFSSPYSTDPYYVQYDGLTTVLTASHVVLPCETYHLKLAVSDMGDGVLDSGVFIKAGSLSSPGVTIDYSYDIGGYPTLIEGCNNGQLDFKLSFPPIDTIEVNLIISGTATNGVDYSTLPALITFLPGDTIETFYINVTPDAIAEGIETIVISGELSCSVSSGDSIVININDHVPLEAWPDTSICPGDSVILHAEGGNVFIWDNYETLEEYVGADVVARPVQTTDYIVTAVFYSCLNWDTVTITVDEPLVDAGPDQNIKWGSHTELDGSGGVTYSWSPTSTLSDPLIANPIADPEVSTQYILTVTSELGCTYEDSMYVYVFKDPVVYIPNAFTPNGDGLNDLLKVITFDDVTMRDFSIYDRWGKIIFETDDMNTGWDGTYLNKDLEVGAYLYIFTGEDARQDPIQLEGQINLIR